MSEFVPDQKLIACYAYEGVMSLDIVGPLQVFASANDELVRMGRPKAYDVVVVAEMQGPIQTSCGVRLYADVSASDLELGVVDTLLIPGGDGGCELSKNTKLINWIKSAEQHVARLGSVCSGALLLAEAGVLDGRMATTHWSRCAQMEREFPAVHMMGDRLHSYDPSGQDGDPNVFTCFCRWSID